VAARRSPAVGADWGMAFCGRLFHCLKRYTSSLPENHAAWHEEKALEDKNKVVPLQLRLPPIPSPVT